MKALAATAYGPRLCVDAGHWFPRHRARLLSDEHGLNMGAAHERNVERRDRMLGEREREGQHVARD